MLQASVDGIVEGKPVTVGIRLRCGNFKIHEHEAVAYFGRNGHSFREEIISKTGETCEQLAERVFKNLIDDLTSKYTGSNVNFKKFVQFIEEFRDQQVLPKLRNN